MGDIPATESEPEEEPECSDFVKSRRRIEYALLTFA